VSTLIHLVNAVHAVAPNYQTPFLRRLQHRFQRRVKPRDNRPRMVQPSQLYALGFNLMNQAGGIADAREAARTFRDGLIIAVLVSSALRRKNLAGLAFNKDLRRGGHHYHIAIEAQATKQRKAIDHPLPAELTPCLDEYLHNYRLRFAGAQKNDALWTTLRAADRNVGSRTASGPYGQGCQVGRHARYPLHPTSQA
jgi:integrase